MTSAPAVRSLGEAMPPIAPGVLRWLLAGDVAVRWQVVEDVVRGPATEALELRRRVASEGWGARLLSLQDDDGTWGGGLYNPKWTSTTYTLLLLRDFGLSANIRSVHAACAMLLDQGIRVDGGVNFGSARSET